MSKLNVLVAGSTGYIGVQLIKLLIKHKNIKIKYLCGNSSIGKKISFYDKTIKKKLPKISKLNKSKISECDIIFTALPNGDAQKISNFLNKKNTLIDLSADFRLNDSKSYLKWYKKNHKSVKNIKNSIYSLPELNQKNIKKYQIISCPGCYPTSILLPLIPLVKKKLIKLDNIIIDSKSGYSGAGRGVHKKYANKNLYESLSAYGVGFHRHNSEIEQEMKNYINSNFKVTFTPHLTPMFRGILSTIYIDLKKNIDQTKVIKELKNFYKNKKFVKVMNNDKLLSTNEVINTNYCYISVCKSKYKNKLILLSVIDNLIKGGSGQAIQNMNQKFKFKENEGLI
jgi:N-acetyl-gamma-glutamyl-phosphate reductase